MGILLRYFVFCWQLNTLKALFGPKLFSSQYKGHGDSVSHIVWNIINLSDLRQTDRKENVPVESPLQNSGHSLHFLGHCSFPETSLLFIHYCCRWSIRRHETEKQCISEISSILFVAIINYQTLNKISRNNYLKMSKCYIYFLFHIKTVIWDRDVVQW